MTIAVYGRNTLAGAKRIVFDEGINIAPRAPSSRERLITLSRRWQATQERKEEAAKAIEDAIERARRLHRKIPRPYVDPVAGTSPRKLIAMVAAWHGVGELDVMGKDRRRNAVDARHDAVVAVYLNCKIDGRRYSLTELGRVFGIDHTSALHALKKRGVK